ncbi:MAG: hypothetical protein N2Z61_00400 [Tepidimonas fonticaldi]|nr:hypothetical protein [Tepidimonas fonticaldi]
MSTVNVDLRKFKKAREWRREDAAALFGTDGSWEWFKRTHRRELVESGALIVRTGRSGDLVHTDRIGPVVQRILVTESIKRLELATA